MADKIIMSYETVALDDEKSALVILDQTKLPYEVEILSLTDQKDIWNAIYLLQVRGAPAIGVAAGFGVYLAAKQIQADNWEDFYTQFKAAKDYLNSSRPTAVNLSWALNRMEQVVLDNKDKSIPELKELRRVRPDAHQGRRRHPHPLQRRPAGHLQVRHRAGPHSPGPRARHELPRLYG